MHRELEPLGCSGAIAERQEHLLILDGCFNGCYFFSMLTLAALLEEAADVGCLHRWAWIEPVAGSQ